MEVERYANAADRFALLHDKIKDNPASTAESAELEDLLGQCFQGQSKYDEAE